MLHDVIQVLPQKDFTVYVYFSDGQIKLYNMRPFPFFIKKEPGFCMIRGSLPLLHRIAQINTQRDRVY
jgi:hypothetical protein